MNKEIPDINRSAIQTTPITTVAQQNKALLDVARRVFDTEAKAIAALQNKLDDQFATACHLLLECRGRVVVCGVGKSGHIANKIAATLASTGTPSFFVHPAEASHGDLGMITPEAVSYTHLTLPTILRV